jgi:hypothetical protein
MTAPHWNQAAWFKSSRSAGNGACIEIAAIVGGIIGGTVGGTVGVRDSKDPHSPILEFSSASWTAFARSIQQGGLTK